MIRLVLKTILNILNGKLKNTVVYRVLRKFDLFLMNRNRKVYQNTIGRLKRYAKGYKIKNASETRNSHEWSCEKFNTEYNPFVSVIVPNYNHSDYLKDRLDSIYQQTYQNFEVILLDDCSTDNSREILTKYQERYPKKTRTIFNEHNTGCVFRQWEKGIQNSKGELIWIAESDDYCELDFLEKMTKNFRVNSVMLAFSESIFVQEKQQIWSIQEYLSDINVFDWNKNFTCSASELVSNAFAYKNIIPNVSSVLFRNVGYLNLDFKEEWFKYQLCGDWLFYLEIIRGGCVTYSVDTCNYYRIHVGSTSKKVQKQQRYYEEYFKVSKYAASYYKISDRVWRRNLSVLKEKAKADNLNIDVENIYKISDLNSISPSLNIVMCVFSMDSGGGETYPIYLANQMRKDGYTVSIIDFGMAEHKEEIMKLISPMVPVIRMKSVDDLYFILKNIQCDIIHSHHGSVDGIVAKWLNDTDLDCKHVITLHGMYEAIEKEDCDNLIANVMNSCSRFIYIADKNLQPFFERNCFDKKKFVKMPNGLPKLQTNYIDRRSLEIEKDAFVLCLVSRAIPEKGWYEAIEAVQRANKLSKRNIELLLIGGGGVEEKCRKEVHDPRIHILGIKNNVRDYFALSDVGILPTYFKGESYPLVVIESLLCGKPVIVTDIAETPNMILDEQGNPAGELIDLVDGKIDVDELVDVIVNLANDVQWYNMLKERTISASEKFDISIISQKYIREYEKVNKRG